MKKRKLFIGTLVALSFLLGAFTSRHLIEAITADDVKKSAKIIGLEMTKSEIDSLLPGLEELRTNYQANRAKDIPNSLSPALQFDPKPIGFQPNMQRSGVSYSNPGEVKMPENQDDLAHYSVRELAELVRSQLITSEALTKFYLERLKKYDPQLKCVITLTEATALAQARKADSEIKSGNYKGLLHGIPYGAKDLLATKEHKTTWGAAPFKDQAFDYNATVIQKLEDAGAVLVAKLTLGALAWGDVWYDGKTRNPWDTSRGSSGSSAGSASAVAAGLVPFAIGTETLGSIVSPSTECGTTGLRPTFGRVSRHGAMALSWSMDKIGPICRTVEDCAIVLAAIQGPDGKDQSVSNIPFNYNPSMSLNRGVKIGYLKEAFESEHPTREQDLMVLTILRRLGYKLTPIELPEVPDIRLILEAEAAAAFDELTRSGKDDQMVRQIKNAWPNVFRTARFIPAVEYIQANRLRSQLIEEMDEAIKDVDVFVHPSFSSLGLTNLTGHPCVVLPSGLKDGRPTSISFTGKLYDEGTILAVAKAYQDRTSHHKQHPELKE